MLYKYIVREKRYLSYSANIKLHLINLMSRSYSHVVVDVFFTMYLSLMIKYLLYISFRINAIIVLLDGF